MRFRVLVVVGLLGSLLASLQPSATAQVIDCSPFDSWQWAQSYFDSNPDGYRATMDPDGNGIACEHLTVHGFPPYLWGGGLPAGAEPVQVTNVTDGDTFEITNANGFSDTVRMYHINAPETSNLGGGPQCGGESATHQLSFILGFAPNNTVYLEYDLTGRDQFDRRLAYVWYELGGYAYMVNSAMVRTGYAESETFEPDIKYRDQLNTDEQFSVFHVLGVRAECGTFGQPLGAQPSDQQKREACQRQPQQGQLAWSCPFDPAPAPPPPPVPTPPPVPPSEQPPGGCDASYPTVCIPPAWQAGDLDCGDIPYRRFDVIPPDPHNFDGDFDSIGCESG